MKRDFYKDVIALAGILQAAELVEQLATSGSASEAYFETSIASVLKLNPATIEEIYDGQVNFIPGLRLGFEALRDTLEKKQNPHSNRLRYAIGLIHLQNKLRRNEALLEVLRQRLEQMESRLAHFDLTHERTLAGLASIYEDTLSTFNFRIQVSGERQHLQNPANVDKIRSALLAGIRAAMLWRQVGGKRWHLLLYRKNLLATVKTLL